MTAQGTPELTERQARGLEYRRERALQKTDELLHEPVALEVARRDTPLVEP